MKPFNPALRLAGIFAVSAFLSFARLGAQEDELVTVYFHATGHSTYDQNGVPVTGYLSASIPEGKTVADPSVSARTRLSEVTMADAMTTPWTDLRVEVGRIYHVTIQTSGVIWGSSYFEMKTPPGYFHEPINQTGPYYPGTYSFRIMPDNVDGAPRRAGEAEHFTSGRTSWGVALGARGNGTSAGSIRLIDVGFESSWDGVYSPAGLKIFSRLPVYNVSGLPRQMKTPEVLVDIYTVSGTEYELRFYDASLFSETDYPYSVSGKSPYVVYNLKKPGSSSTELQITKTTYGSTTRVEKTTLTRSGTWPTYSWTANDWNKDGDTQLVQTADTWAGVSGSDYTSSVVLKNPTTSATAAESLRTLNKFTWGEAPASVRTGPSGDNLTTSYTYYTDASDADSYSRVKTVTYPSDAWEGYEYYGWGGANGMTYGGFRVHRPYINSPASVPSNLTTDTSGEISTYWFAYRDPGTPGAVPADKRPLRLAKVERTINVSGSATLAAKTEFDYYPTVPSASTYSANGRALVRATRYDWTENNSGTRLKTITRYHDGFNDGLANDQILSIERPDKSKTAFAYHTGSWSSGAFTVGTGTATRVSVVQGTSDPAIGTAAPSLDAYSFTSSNDTVTDVLRLVTGRSTMESTIRDSRARIVRRESLVWNGSAWQFLSAETFGYDTAGFVTDHTAGNGAHYTATYDGELKSTDTDATGVVTSYTAFDSTGRLTSSTRAGAGGSPDPVPAVVKSYAYDAANRLTSQITGSSGSEQIVSSRTFDTAGRVTAEYAPGPSGAVTTSYAYASLSSGYSRTATLPNFKTRIETMNPDGSLASITGTGVIAQTFIRTIETGSGISGQRYTRVETGSSSRKVESWTDWLGRTVKTSRPGFSATTPGQAPSVGQSYYDSTTGQLTRTTLTGYADTLYEYDSMGRMKRSGLDVSTSGTLTDNSLDRITESDVAIEQPFDSDWWLRETTSTFFTDNGATKTRVATSRTRLSGFSGNVQAESRIWDAEDADNSSTIQTSKQVVAVDRTAKTVTQTTTRAGISNAAVRTIKNGAVISELGHDNLTTTFAYDALARLTSSTDPRTGATVTAYKSGTALPDTVTSPASTIVTYGYDSIGRVISIKNPDNKYAYTAYDDLGRAYRQWGDAVTPVEYGYDSTYGDPTTLKTYRAGTGWTSSTWPGSPGTADTTTSVYDAPSGLLISKADAASAAVTYEYNTRGQVSKRTWARGTSANYSYDGSTGELTGISYSDSTPAVTYAYTRASQVKTAGDPTTGTHTFTYDSSKPWRLDRDELPSYLGDRWLSPLYESSGMVGRATGFQLGNSSTRDADLKQEWQFESATGRFDKVLSSYSGGNTRTFDYGYYGTNSDLIGSLTVTNPGGGASPFTVARAYEANRDLVTQVQTKWSGSAVAQFDYGYTSLGQRDWEKRGGSTFAIDSQTVTTDFQYNDRGELTKALAYLGTESDIGNAAKKMPNLQHEYGYDNVGNRTSANQTGDSARVDSFTANNLNQITARDNKTVIASGTVGNTAAVAVKVNGGALVAADRQGSYWSKALTPANSTAPDSADFVVLAGQGSSATRTETSIAYTGQVSQSISRDADGNITGDGVWTYDWDAENRLITMTPVSGAVTAGFPNKKIEFKYDYAGRRVQKTVSDWNGSAWTVTTGRRFIYDGWNVIAEYDAPGGTSFGSLKRSNTWGLDLAGSLSATGGVGSLLQTIDHENIKSYLPAYDANGNVMALYEASGSGVAAVTYEYSPFGETLRAEIDPSLSTGVKAVLASQPFRFSTKFTDVETGLVYYGHRYYSPSLGRFISRDPLGEAGGLNLYGFAGNDGVNGFDVLGLWEWDNPPDGSMGGMGGLPGFYGIDFFGPGIWNSWDTVFANAAIRHEQEAARRDARAKSDEAFAANAALGLEIDKRLVYRPRRMEFNANKVTGTDAGHAPSNTAWDAQFAVDMQSRLASTSNEVGLMRTNPGYTTLNAAEIEGREIVAVYMVDAADAALPSNIRKYTKNGTPYDVIDVTRHFRDVQAEKIAKLNQQLSATGKGVAFVVIDSAEGYQNYLRAMPESTKYFVPVFHGSGGGPSDGPTPIRIRMLGTSRTDYPLEKFITDTQRLLPRGVFLDPVYCIPLEGKISPDLGPEMIADRLHINLK